MLNGYENVVLVFVCVALSCAFLVLLNRCWLPASRRAHNDVVGWQIAVVGTIYAVMIGFMLYAVWGNFQSADSNVDAEANVLVNLFRSAEGLPEPQRDSIQKLTRDYADAMLTDTWPAMNRGTLGTKDHPIIQQLWSVLMSTETSTTAQQTSFNHSLFELRSLTRHRRLRELQSSSSLPAILWAVLICGGIITIVSACLFGSENRSLQFVLVCSLALLISLILAAIADIDGPFRGSVRINPYAFARAQTTMSEPVSIPK